MFGRSRKKATEHTVNAVRPLIGVFQQSHGLPTNFWRDEFVLGFVGFMISFHANFTSGQKLSQQDKGILFNDVFTSLSNLNGESIGRQFTRLATQEEKSETFEKGGDYAAICATYSIGKMDENGRPWIAKAKNMAAAQGNENDHGAVAAFLFHLLFYQPLHERFDDHKQSDL